jgi:hypothetical protein
MPEDKIDRLPGASASARTKDVEGSFVKGATRGLILSATAFGIAGGMATVLFASLALFQAYWLIVIVPFVALGFVTLGAIILLRLDKPSWSATGKKKQASSGG